MKLAEGLWARRVRGQAKGLVSSRFDRLLLRADVVHWVRTDPALDPEYRRPPWPWPDLARVGIGPQQRGPDAGQAPQPSRSRLPTRPPPGRTACRLEPGNSPYYHLFLNTLGVAQYRMGQYEKARATLTQSNRLNGNRQSADLAFLAMTQHQLNQVAAAHATLERLGEVMKADPRIAGNEENQGFLREAETVILYSPELPEDVFAPPSTTLSTDLRCREPRKGMRTKRIPQVPRTPLPNWLSSSYPSASISGGARAVRPSNATSPDCSPSIRTRTAIPSPRSSPTPPSSDSRG